MWVMSQVGHADSKMTTDVYNQLQQRVRRDHGRAFDALVRQARDTSTVPRHRPCLQKRHLSGRPERVPRISAIYGIVIGMYWREAHHLVPHFHAEYSGHEASIAVDGTVLGGSLPPRALRLVRAWARLHETELLANWERARERQPLDPIDPLRSMSPMTDVPPLVHITGVEVIGDHELRLTFEDGTVGDVAFGDHEWRGVFEPLQDPAFFAQVTVDPQWGTIAWPGDLDMAPEPLYDEARRNAVTTSTSR
jgi:hypothetical protein